MYSLILVDFNTIDITTEYLARCRKALGVRGASHAIIVENGSNDGIPEKLESLYGTPKLCPVEGVEQAVYCYETADQKILYCHSGENMGYARGNNLGIRIAKAVFDDPYYIVSNNDLVFPKAVDLQLGDQIFRDHPEIGIIGPRITTPAGEFQSPNQFESAFRRLFAFYWKPLTRLWKKLFCRKAAASGPAKSGPCDWVSGCFMLLRAEAMEKAGMFDGNTFLYAEELILSRRMTANNYCTWYCDELHVVHQHAQTTKKALSALRAKDINFQSIHYYYKTYTNTSGFVLLLARVNYWIHRSVFWCAHKLSELFRRHKEQS